MELQTDGNVLLAGSASPRMHLARFVGGGPPPTPTPTPTGTATPTPTPTPTVTPTPTPTPTEEIFGGARYAFRKRKPIRDVLITLDGPGGLRSTYTDNSGRYNFQSVPYGQFTITASHPEYVFLDNPRVVTVPQFVHGVYSLGITQIDDLYLFRRGQRLSFMAGFQPVE